MNAQMILNMMMQNNPQAKSNPIFQNAMQMAQNGNCQDLRKLAENLAQAKGIDLNSFKSQIESNMRTFR